MRARRKPLLVIDARTVGPVPHGMARYATAIAEGLGKLASEGSLRYDVAFIVGPQESRGGALPEAFARFRTIECTALLFHPREWLEVPRILVREKADAFHSPTFASLVWCPCPWAITVHDLNHLKFGSFAHRAYYQLVLRPFARRARKPLTVSRFSRAEITRWLGMEESSIEVTYNALDPALVTGDEDSEAGTPEILKSLGLQAGKYFFCVSNPKPHKNLRMLVEAFRKYRAESRASEQDLPLVLVGVDEASVGASEGLKYAAAVDDASLRALMRNATAVAFPSLYEGFGLPPLEAAALGSAVLVSDIPPHREALEELEGPEAIWLDPSDADAWARAMRAAADASGQGTLRRPSREVRQRLVARYSASALAAQLDRVYSDMIGL